MASQKLGKLKVFPAVGDCGKTQREWDGTVGLTSLQKVDFKLAVELCLAACHRYRVYS